MSLKFSQLPSLTSLDTSVIFPIVESSGPTSYTTPITTLTNYILAGNAATATKLATPVTINGVSFDGSSNISITASVAIATNSVLGAVKVGTGISVASDGTISTNPLVPATTTVLGGIITPIGSGNKIDSNGNLSTNNVLHAFAFDANNNLIYTKNTNTSTNLTSDGQNSTYSTVELGTDQYAYSVDSFGNLIATFNY